MTFFLLKVIFFYTLASSLEQIEDNKIIKELSYWIPATIVALLQ